MSKKKKKKKKGFWADFQKERKSGKGIGGYLQRLANAQDDSSSFKF